MAWTDEKKAEVIAAYENANPTPETSIEIVKEIAKEIDESENGIRMVLSKAGVYVKKTAAKSSGTAATSEGGAKRVSKEDAINSLKSALTDAGQEVDASILDKLTGKAASYLATIVIALSNSEDAQPDSE